MTPFLCLQQLPISRREKNPSLPLLKGLCDPQLCTLTSPPVTLFSLIRLSAATWDKTVFSSVVRVWIQVLLNLLLPFTLILCWNVTLSEAASFPTFSFPFPSLYFLTSIATWNMSVSFLTRRQSKWEKGLLSSVFRLTHCTWRQWAGGRCGLIFVEGTSKWHSWERVFTHTISFFLWWQIISMRRKYCWQDSGNFKAETKSVEEEQIIRDYGSYSRMV